MSASTISRPSLTDSVSAVTGDIVNAAFFGTNVYDKIDALFTASLTIARSGAGDIAFTVENASNTANSDALLTASVAGSSAGDAYATFTVASVTTWAIGVDNSDSDRFKIDPNTLGSANLFALSAAGLLGIGVATNTGMTQGITITQGASDDEILALKSSDVAHGMTTLAETDTYGSFRKIDPTGGGLQMRGFADTQVYGLLLSGIGVSEDTAKSTAAAAAVIVDGAKASGTGAAALGANGNVLCVRVNGTTRFIFDADGDSHQDVGTAWTNFDAFDDIALLTALSGAVSRADDPLKAGFGAWLQTHRATLEQARMVTINDGPTGDGSVFINWSRTQMLLIGAVRQLAARLDETVQTRTPLWRRWFATRRAH